VCTRDWSGIDGTVATMQNNPNVTLCLLCFPNPANHTDPYSNPVPKHEGRYIVWLE